MGKNEQLKFTLMFDTNTSNAKRGIQDLQRTLNSLTKNIEIGEFKMTREVQDAYIAAEKLKTVLNQAVNMDTGKLDFSRLSNGLKQAGTSVQDIANKFAGLGPQGVKAFSEIASSISKAEVPTKRMNALLDNFVTQLKQSAQWQLSNSIIRGFSGALQSAYGYAKDLNRSLTDIRIVAEKDKDWMAQFAEEANRAAKALSTTTTEYTKASLIFFQQGLDDADVKRRTDAVIKMANVTGESADDISSYMTAVWNNFDDGSKSLEYYADVITALGAATASSSEEIATGIQKFASVADTVGLSYNYAASALATVVSATRQSEDTIGTAFKTIFARLSSLQLGETLEDDTTLTKYSSALAQVGVNIKDANGEIKSMDRILDELGTKWNNISRETQNALAYTVAGTRQYTNFIALMDNYDTFKINIQTAEEAEGTLEEQQKIYAESWQAAADEVRAAMEGIFQDLIDDDFFIDLLDGFEKLLSMLDTFIDAIGGLPGVLSLISTLMLRIFSTQAKQGLENLGYGLKSFLGLNADEAINTKKDWMKTSNELVKKMETEQTDTLAVNIFKVEKEFLEKKIALETEYARVESSLTEEQKNQYQLQMALLDIMRQQAVEAEKARHAADEENTNITKRVGAIVASQVRGEAYTEEEIADINARVEAAKSSLDAANANEALAEVKQKAAKKRVIDYAKLIAPYGEMSLDEAESKAQGGLADIAKALGKSGEEVGAFIELYRGPKDSLLSFEEQAKRFAELRAGVQESVNGLFAKNSRIAVEDWSDEDQEARRSQAKIISELDYVLKMYRDIHRRKEEFSENEQRTTSSILTEMSQREREAAEAVKKATEARKKAEEALAEALRVQDEAVNIGTKPRNTDGKPDGFGSEAEQYFKRMSELYKGYRMGTTSSRAQIEELKKIWAAQGWDSIDARKTSVSSLREALQKFLDKGSDERGVISLETEKIIRDTIAEIQGLYDENGRIGEENLKNFVAKGRWTSWGNVVHSIHKSSETEGMLEQIRATLKDSYGIEISDEDWTAYTQSMEDYIKTTNRVTKAKELQGETVEETKKIMKDEAKVNKNAVTSMSDLFIKVSQAASAASSLAFTIKGLWDTMSNPDLSVWDKILAFISSFSTILISLTTVIPAITAIFKKQTAEVTLSSLATGLNTIATKLNTKARKENAAAADQQEQEIKEKTGAEVTETVTETVTDGVKKSGGNIASSLSMIGSSLTAILPTILPIAIAIAAIVATIAISVEIYNAAEKAAKKAEKTAQVAQEAAEDLKSEYQELSNTISGFEDTQEKIEGLTKGTQEWRDAIMESNDQARKLIDTFGSDLKAGDYYFENGQIKFKEGVLESLQQKEYENMLSGQAAADAAEIVAMQRREEADSLSYARENMSSVTSDAIATGLLFSIPFGILGGVIAGTYAASNPKEELDAIDKLAEAYQKDELAFDKMIEAQQKGNLNEYAKTLGISEEVAKGLLENKEATRDLINEMAVNSNKMMLLRQTMVNAINVGKEGYDDSPNSSYIDNIIARDMGNEESERMKTASQAVKSMSDSQVIEALKETGLYSPEKYRFENTGGGNVTLKIKDDTGNFVTSEAGWQGVSYADLRAQLIDFMAADLSEAELNALNKDISTSISKAFQPTTKENKNLVNKVLAQAATGKQENVDLSEFSKIQLEFIKTSQIVDKNVAEIIKKARRAAIQAWDDIVNQFSSHTQSLINSLSGEELGLFSKIQLENYGKILEDLTRIGGKGASEIFSENFNSLLITHKDQAAEILAVFNSIENWEIPEEGLYAFEGALQDLGIQLDVMSWTTKEIGKTLGEYDFSPDFLNSLSYLDKTLTTLQEFANYKLGDIIDEETVQKLIELGYGDNLKQISSTTDKDGNTVKRYQVTSSIDDRELQNRVFQNRVDAVDEAMETSDYLDRVGEQYWYQWSKGNYEEGKEDYWYYINSLLNDSEGMQALGVTPEQLIEDLKNYQEKTKQMQNDKYMMQYISDIAGVDFSQLTNSYDKELVKRYLYGGYSTSNYYAMMDSLFTEMNNAYSYGDEQAASILETIYYNARQIENEQGVEEAVKYLNSANYEEYLNYQGKVDAYKETFSSIAQTYSTEGIDNTEIDVLDSMKQVAGSAVSLGQLEWLKETGRITDSVYNEYKGKLESEIEENKKSQNIFEDEEAYIESINDQLEKQKDITEDLVGLNKIQPLEEELRLNKEIYKTNLQSLELAKGQRDKKIQEIKDYLENELHIDPNIIKFDPFGNVINSEEIKNQGIADTTIIDKLLSDLQTAQDNVIQYESASRDSLNNVRESWNAISEAQIEANENLSEHIDTVKSLYETYKEVIDLVGKEKLELETEDILEINNKLLDLSKQQLAVSHQNYEAAKKNRKELEDKVLLGAATPQQVEEALKQESDFLKAQYDEIVNYLSKAKDLLQDNINQTMEDFEKSYLGEIGSFEEMTKIFSQQSELDNLYLDNYKKTYEINKLMRNIQKSIDETDNAKSKRVLNSLQAELNAYQADGVEMSEYDLNLMQKKYEMRLAEIALEEAQNSKNQVRLQKMSDGSWGYVYTQNAEAIDKAQQDYEDKLYSLQELNDSYLEQMSSQFISVQKEMTEALLQVDDIWGLQGEEREQAINRITEYYTEKLNYISSETDKAVENNKAMGIISEFADTTLGKLYGGFGSATEASNNFLEQLGSTEDKNSLLGKMYELSDGYSNTVNQMFETLGTKAEDFKNNFAVMVETLRKAYEDLMNISSAPKKSIEEMAQALIDNNIFSENAVNNNMSDYAIWKWYNRRILGLSASALTRDIFDLMGYDTGGYTGEWGPEGRLALLHQKEIVLNAKDTENLLQVIDVVDTLIRNIDFESAAAAAGRALTAAVVPSFGDTLQQEVTIHAEFPNATNHSEIEEAFNTLINRATQYVNRK